MIITLHGSVAEMVQKQVSTASYQSAEDLVYEALVSFNAFKLEKQNP